MNAENNKSSERPSNSEEFPLGHLYFYLTEGCNLACRHCYLAPKFDPDGEKYQMLSFELFKKAINEAIPLGLSGVKLTGGEPLLHPDIIPMMEILRQKELSATIETNGILCNTKITKSIARLKDPFVSVSLDGADAETHDSVRGVIGAFKKATAAIQLLAENGIRPQVIMTIMQHNEGQMKAVIELAEKLGANSVKFNIIQPSGRGEALFSANHGLSIKELLAIGRKVESEFIHKTSLELHFDYPAAFRSLSHIASKDGCSVCNIFSILGVLPSGEYGLCGMATHVNQFHFGRIGKDPLEKIWQENQILKEIREGLPEKLSGVCSHCLMKHLCLGSCIAMNYYRANSLWAPYWFCEEAYFAGLFPDSRLDLSLTNDQ